MDQQRREAVAFEAFDGAVVEGDVAHLGRIAGLDREAMILGGDEHAGACRAPARALPRRESVRGPALWERSPVLKPGSSQTGDRATSEIAAHQVEIDDARDRVIEDAA